MSLFEVERLVDRLEEHLKPDAQTATVPRDAQEYAEWCKKANKRIDVILALMDAGDLHQAMTLEQQDPVLMDLIQTLSFPQLPAWRKLLESMNLTSPPDIKRQFTQKLGELYVLDLQKLDEQWRKYNGFMLREDFQGALKVVRQIVKIAPEDRNAKLELEQLEELDFNERFEALCDLVESRNANAVLAALPGLALLLRKFEPTPEQREVWIRAKGMEVDVWFGWMNEFSNQGNWVEGLHYSMEIKRAQGEHGIVLLPLQQNRVEEVLNWAASQKAETGQWTDFKQHYSLLQDLVGQAKLPNREANLLDQQVAANELNQLSEVWNRCQQYPDHVVGSIDVGVSDFFRHRINQLQSRLDQLARWRRIKWGAACTVFLIGLVVVFVMVTKSRTAREYVARIDQGVIDKLAQDVYTQVQHATNHYAGSTPPQVAESIGRAEVYLGDQRGRSNALDQATGQLEEMIKILDLSEVGSFTNRLASSTNAVREISSQWNKELDLRLIAAENDWETFKENQAATGEQALTSAIDKVQLNIETHFMPDEPGLDELESFISEARTDLTAVDVFVRAAYLGFPANLTARYQALVRKVEERSNELTEFRKANESLTGVATLMDYRQILVSFRRTQLLPRGQRAPLNLVLESGLHEGGGSSDVIIRSLVFADDGHFFDSLKDRRAIMFPTNTIPAEVVAELVKADKHPHIYGVREWVVPEGQTKIVPGVSSTPYEAFYQTRDEDGMFRPFGIKGNVELANWGVLDARRWTQQIMQNHLSPVECIQMNEAFTIAAGVERTLLKGLPGNDRAFKGEPLGYIEAVCRQIAVGKLEPLIGLWKLKQFTDTLFPTVGIGKSRPAAGTHYWEFGVPQEFIRAFKKDLNNAYPGGSKKLAPSDWVKHFPLGSVGKKPSANYETLKTNAIAFARKYEKCAVQLRGFRSVYHDVILSGVQYAGYHRLGNHVLLDSVPKEKPLLGLVGPGKWIIVSRQDSDQPLLEFTPLFVLGTSYGTERKLPTINNKWYEFPELLSHSAEETATPPEKNHDTTK